MRTAINPPYAAIGIAAPLILVGLRLVQGFGLGGEWGGVVLLISEHASPRNRGFWTSWAQAGGPLGSLMSTAVLAILAASMSDGSFVSWGWRIAFGLSAVLIVVAYFLRRSVHESGVFLEESKALAETPRTPIRDAVRTHRRPIVISAMACIGEKATYYTFGVFSLTYLVEVVGVAKTTVLTGLTIASVFWIVAMLLGGFASDRFGRVPVTLTGVALAMIAVPAGLVFMAGGNTTVIVVCLTVGVVADGIVTGGTAAMFSELFPTRIRYSGASIGYQVATIVGGSLTPIIGIALLEITGSVVPVACFVLALLALTALAMKIDRK